EQPTGTAGDGRQPPGFLVERLAAVGLGIVLIQAPEREADLAVNTGPRGEIGVCLAGSRRHVGAEAEWVGRGRLSYGLWVVRIAHVPRRVRGGLGLAGQGPDGDCAGETKGDFQFHGLLPETSVSIAFHKSQ